MRVGSSSGVCTTELLAVDGLYRQIYDLQLRDQEEFVEAEKRIAPAGNGAAKQ